MARKHSVAVGKIFDGVVECQELDTLLAGVAHLVGTCRYLVLAAAIDYHGLLGSEAQCGAHGVHGGVSGTDDGDALAMQRHHVLTVYLVAHKVVAYQVLVGGHHAGQVLAGYAHEPGLSGTCGDIDALESLSPQLVVGQCGTHKAVFLELDPEGCDLGNLGVDDILGEAELGDAVFEHSAETVERLEDCDVISALGHVAREREP